MRVLLTTDTIGGVWTFTRELTTELLHQEHAVSLVSFGRLPSPAQQAWTEQTLRLFLEKFRYTGSDLALEWMPENGDAFAAGVAVLQREMDLFAPDLLHSNQFCFGALPGLLPRLVTAHSDVLSWADACRPDGLEPSPWLTQYTALVERGLTNAQAVSAPTHWMASALRRKFPMGPAPTVIANGRTLMGEEFVMGEQVQAVSAGRLWDEAKNTALLGDVQTPMPVVNAGDRALTVVTRPSAPGAHDRKLQHGGVTFTGALADEALHALFRESSIYIATSVYEPFGLAPLEAALCGCAVLANDLPSFREVWGDAAMYFRGARSLESCLGKLADDPGELRTWRERARVRALHFTARRMADAYLSLYAQMLKPAEFHEAAFASPAAPAKERIEHAV